MPKLFLIFLFCTSALIHSYSQAILYYDNSVKVIELNKTLDDPWGGGLNAAQFGMIDFTGDGIEDLVLYDRSAGTLNTFRFDSGSFIFSPQYMNYFPADLAGYVLFRDYDGDGFKDIFTDGSKGMKAYHNITSGEYPEFEIAADPVLTLTNSGLINMQVNYADVPDISDLDSDGDLDILVYNFAIGTSIRHHRNMSMEKYGNSESLDFELVNREWGQFQECVCHVFAFVSLGETCESLSGSRVMHVGGKSLLTLDMDGDGDRDFLGGHEDCNELYYFPNFGSPDTALMTTFSEFFPDSAGRANFPVFPTAYFDDFDHDGIDDLIVSPNAENNLFRNINFNHSAWLYSNSGQNSFPDFQLITREFLQYGMIDLGENAVPSLEDIDQDGDADLLIAGNGFPVDGVFYGYLKLFENTGSAISPEFTLADPDYLDLSAFKVFDPFIAFADFNHDGSPDLFLSGISGSSVVSRIFYNNSGPGKPYRFNSSETQIIDIPLETRDTPCFADVDNDGLVDMLLGKHSGRLDYFRNMGDENNPYFVLELNDYLDIRDSYTEFRLNLVPWVGDIDLDGHDDLLTSDYQGDIFVYRDFKNKEAREAVLFYNSLRDLDEHWKQGYQTWIAGRNLFKGHYPSLIFGNKQGGLTLYRQEPKGSPGTVGLKLKVFPNPVSTGQSLIILASRSGSAVIYSPDGRLLRSGISITANRNSPVVLDSLAPGLYIVKMTDLSGVSRAEKFILIY